VQDRPHILFVEDEETIREHIASALDDEFSVETAGDGEAALHAVLKRRPDLVVTDLVMPGINGIELVRTLRSTPSTSTIPILMVSGRAPDELRIMGFELGADSYLPKPYTERELRARIRATLRSDQLRRDAANRDAREQAEKRSIEERAALLESITDAFYALDRSWHFTYVNQRALDYFGRERSQLIGRNIWEVFPEAKAAFAPRYRRALEEARSIDFEVLSDLSKRWVEVHAYPTGNGLAISFRDISARKAAEEQLRHSEERYRAFVGNSSEAIWRYELTEPLDPTLPREKQLDHIYRHAYLAELNDVMARMYGFDRAQELVGARLEQMFHPNDPAARAYLLRAVDSGYSFTDVESMEPDREGNLRCFSNSMVPVMEEGKLVRAWGMQRDITDRKRMEQMLKENEQRKDDFLAILAHELRNPLAPIRNGLYLLQRKAPSDPFMGSTLQMMDRQMSHMVRLVDDLLDVSRIARGKLELRRAPLMLRDVIERAVESVKSVIEAQGHELSIDLRAPTLYVDGDSDRLTQVFANLLSNSAKYTDRGGQIALIAERSDEEALVTVRDDGIGIPAEALAAVFEMFAQIRSHQGRSDGGLGIGLALVRNLVELHGGTVVAQSEGPGLGSTFTVRLPLVEATSIAPQPEEQQTFQAEGRRILVVDDNEDAALSLATILRERGNEVRTVFDGVQAVRIAADFGPEIIFMDIGMPRMDGIEATRQIRAQAPALPPVIVAVTGWGQDADRQRTRAAGFDEHLVKPVSAASLERVLIDFEKRATRVAGGKL
jgi:PAS domain S-box-containing protein